MNAVAANVPFSITVCDKEGIILSMNEKAIKTFVRDGESLIGKSLLDCHPEPARAKLLELLQNHTINCYTIEKNGVKKMIYQSPWYDGEEFGGYVELSMEIPFEMKHFVRQSSVQ
ncbi:MAG: PAS domain-containing protein [Bacteroidales bacterium]|nr:PAS domain-containing protein [Bacteroidales bacterium]